MKKMNKFLAAALVALAFTSVSNAQSTATATATATVITPIAITKNTDMNFGNVAVQAANAGTVVLAPDGTRTRTAGVTLPAVAGTVTAATFTVTGSGTSSYSITLPTSVTLTHTNGVESMTATSFTSTPSGTGALVAGTQDIAVGATLNVTGGQLAGIYTSTNFDVTVNYN